MTIKYGPWARDISIGGKVVGRVVNADNNSDHWRDERLISGKKVICLALEFYVKRGDKCQE